MMTIPLTFYKKRHVIPLTFYKNKAFIPLTFYIFMVKSCVND